MKYWYANEEEFVEAGQKQSDLTTEEQTPLLDQRRLELDQTPFKGLVEGLVIRGTTIETELKPSFAARNKKRAYASVWIAEQMKACNPHTTKEKQHAPL